MEFDAMNPAIVKACVARDILIIFRLLLDGGMNQREVAALVGMCQSEVSEILNGRRVVAYHVLVRVADGLRIPRGMMGLAGIEVEEVDEDMERRKLLAIAGAIMFGTPVFGQPEPLAVRRVLVDPPSRVGMTDVRRYGQTLAQLQALQRQVGGLASREPLAATARAGEQLLGASMAADLQQRLRLLVCDAHRLAGWAAGDVGLVDDYRVHVHQALDLAVGSPERIAQVLCMAGSMEKSLGDPQYALKLLQLGQSSAADCADPQVRAVLGGETVAGYAALGYPGMAEQELRAARSLFADADISRSLPGFASYGSGHAVLASGELKLGNFGVARGEILNALRKRPLNDVWCNALDTIILATINMRAGEIREGIQQTQRALVLVRQVGSRRLKDRMMPLADALDSRQDSTCRDLVRVVRAVQACERRSALLPPGRGRFVGYPQQRDDECHRRDHAQQDQPDGVVNPGEHPTGADSEDERHRQEGEPGGDLHRGPPRRRLSGHLHTDDGPLHPARPPTEHPDGHPRPRLRPALKLVRAEKQPPA